VSYLVLGISIIFKNKIEFYYTKYNINLVSIFFRPQEPHNKLIETNYQLQIPFNTMCKDKIGKKKSVTKTYNAFAMKKRKRRNNVSFVGP
jgi:hypothetical protein